MDLEKLFYPSSIAVIGASAQLGGGKLPYFLILKMVGFKGDLYPVNPKYDVVDGTRFYHSVDDLPEGIDFAIVSAPARESLAILRAAIRKKIKFIHYFTAGFSEAGNYELEGELQKEAQQNGIHIVGPNCIGVYSSEGNVSFGFSVQEDVDLDTAFIGQSGGVTTNYVHLAIAHRIGLNKVVSFGNQIDIRAEDYLDYFSRDDRLRVITAYLEDLKDTRRFLDTLKQTTERKPVILLKGGMTDVGAKAAASHTGALASDYKVWAAAMRQHGAILVDNLEQLVNVAMLAVCRQKPRGSRVGFLGAGGGTAVTFTDLAAMGGLTLPTLKDSTQEQISTVISDVNTSTNNPVDLGMFGFDFNVMAHVIEALDKDENIDVIVPFFSVNYIAMFQKSQIETGPARILESLQHTTKPVVPVLSRYSQDNVEMEEVRVAMFNTFRKAGLPVYATVQDCIYAVSKYLEWSAHHDCP